MERRFADIFDMLPISASIACLSHYARAYIVPGRNLAECLSQRSPSAVILDTATALAPPMRAPEQFWALKDVSFDVAQGDVIGVMGRNGAGKSTLLKIISPITEPTEGFVVVRREWPVSGSGHWFSSRMTGRENIFLSAMRFWGCGR